MTLEYTLDTLDNLEETTAALYKEVDGKFVLDVTGHESAASMNKIPKSRLDQEIAKRKTAEESLNSVAEAMKSGIPEEYHDLVPELPPAAMVAWIQKMNASGIFDTKEPPVIDNRKPSDKPAVDLDSLPPQAKMAMGYK